MKTGHQQNKLYILSNIRNRCKGSVLNKIWASPCTNGLLHIYMRPVKAQASLHGCADMPEPSLFANEEYGRR